MRNCIAVNLPMTLWSMTRAFMNKEQRIVALWYSQQRPWWWYFLLPLTMLYALVTYGRRWAYSQGWLTSYRAQLPVIVVGNITVGGTGKTPVTLTLVRWLQEQGYQPVIVSRGYGGETTYPAVVTAQSLAHEVGDEPLLLWQQSGVPVVVDRQRARAVALVEAQQLGNIVITDDGLQHYALARDLELVVIDHSRGLGNGWLLPAGPLREPRQRLKTITCVIENGGQQSQPHAHPPVFAMHLQPSACLPVNPECRQAPPQPPMLIHAVAGIGHPLRFFQTLKQLGYQIIEHPFPDHHAFVATDLAFADNLPIVMTSKDAVKCRSFADQRYWQLPVEALLSDDFFLYMTAQLAALPLAKQEQKQHVR